MIPETSAAWSCRRIGFMNEMRFNLELFDSSRRCLGASYSGIEREPEILPVMGVLCN